MTVEERVEKLEIELAHARRSNRLLLAGVLLSFVLLTVAMTAGVASREDVVNAKQFNLLDDNGKIHAKLAMLKDEPGLAMYDVYGKPSILLSLTKDGLRLSLFGAEDKTSVAMCISENKPSLVMSGANGKSSVLLSMTKDVPAFVLFDVDGKQRAVLGAAQTITPDGKVITSPEPSLILYSPDGKVRWQAPQ